VADLCHVEGCVHQVHKEQHYFWCWAPPMCLTS
jgi:hypothetical protein